MRVVNASPIQWLITDGMPTFEREPACRHNVKRDAQAPDITGRAAVILRDDLGRAVEIYLCLADTRSLFHG